MYKRLYLDCDGVLADFDGYFTKVFGHLPGRDMTGNQKAFDAKQWEDLRTHPDFYRHLPLMDDAHHLVNNLRHFRPIILSGVPKGEWAEVQKLDWANRHFPGIPMIVCPSKEKRRYCQPGDILVDDWLKYKDNWTGAGGIFIHHKDAVSSVAEVEARLGGWL